MKNYKMIAVFEDTVIDLGIIEAESYEEALGVTAYYFNTDRRFNHCVDTGEAEYNGQLFSYYDAEVM